MQLTKSLLKTTDSYITRLHRGGIETVEDLLLFFPKGLEDTSEILTSFAYINIQEKNTLKLQLVNIIQERTKYQRQLTKFIVSDENDMLSECVFFHRPFLRQPIQAGDMIVVHGKPKYEYGKLSFVQPDIEKFDASRQEFLPMYSELQGISTKWFRDKIPLVLGMTSLLPEVLPESIRAEKKHRSRATNIIALHRPKDQKDFEQAKHELAYEELFELQYRALQRKKILQDASQGHTTGVPLDADMIKSALEKLDFELTGQQKITLYEILRDMERDISMQRLLQWDVGTGKTVVAFLSLLHWLMGGWWQVVYMAPTTILASQVFRKLEIFLEPYGIKSALLMGSVSAAEKARIKEELIHGDISVVVGTHALIQDDIGFTHLGYVIIDEQHRFGVEQREKLTEYFCEIEHEEAKARVFPHVLMMTATPIPRTLSMAMYGHQDISIIREYPLDHKPIQTKIVAPDHTHEAYDWIAAELQKWHQAYWISPLVHENDQIDAVSVHETADKLMQIFPQAHIAILHGKMKPDEKERIMQDFLAKKYDILSSTSVVEVGVDNPNATVMCIEDAHRFWLSQLHQFRGRVGRWDAQSYCYLLTEKASIERLKALEKSNDGFELSEIDMRLRWPGEVYGMRQSGIPDLKLASMNDLAKIYEIRQDIEKYLQECSR